MMQSLRIPLALFALSLAAATQASFLAGSPAAVSTTMPLNLWAAVIFQLLLWLTGLRGWGALLAKGVGIDSAFSLAVGSLFYALVAFLFGALGWLQPELKWLVFLINAIGCALNPPLRLSLPKRAHELVAFLPLVVLLALNFLDALVIHPYWDPLHHHLLGPRLWWESGKIFFPPDAVSAYQEGGFEMLFLWPHFLFAHAGGLGLLPVQIFAQLTHVLLGFMGSLWLANGILKRGIPELPSRALALALFAVPASLQFGIPTAKNDWGLVLWVIAGLALLFEQKPKTNFLAGLFLGYSLLAKFSAVYAILPALAVIILLAPENRHPRRFLLLAAGFFLGMLPLGLRNYLGTNDFFFPLFAGLFPQTILGPTWIKALHAYQSGHVSFFGRLLEWSREFLFAPLLLLLPWLWKKPSPPLVRSLAIALPLSFLLFFLTAGAPAELRLLGACLPLSGLLVGVILQRMAERSPYPQFFPWVMLALLLPFLPFRWEALRRLPAIAHPELQARGYVGAEAQAWFREQYQPGMKAALLVDTRLYHSVPYPIVRIWDAPKLDSALRAAASPENFLAVLHGSGFSHLILTQEKLDLFYPAELVAQVEGWVLAHPEHVVFRTPYSMVLDLRTF